MVKKVADTKQWARLNHKGRRGNEQVLWTVKKLSDTNSACAHKVRGKVQ